MPPTSSAPRLCSFVGLIDVSIAHGSHCHPTGTKHFIISPFRTAAMTLVLILALVVILRRRLVVLPLGILLDSAGTKRLATRLDCLPEVRFIVGGTPLGNGSEGGRVKIELALLETFMDATVILLQTAYHDHCLHHAGDGHATGSKALELYLNVRLILGDGLIPQSLQHTKNGKNHDIRKT